MVRKVTRKPVKGKRPVSPTVTEPDAGQGASPTKDWVTENEMHDELVTGAGKQNVSNDKASRKRPVDEESSEGKNSTPKLADNSASADTSGKMQTVKKKLFFGPPQDEVVGESQQKDLVLSIEDQFSDNTPVHSTPSPGSVDPNISVYLPYADRLEKKLIFDDDHLIKPRSMLTTRAHFHTMPLPPVNSTMPVPEPNGCYANIWAAILQNKNEIADFSMDGADAVGKLSRELVESQKRLIRHYIGKSDNFRKTLYFLKTTPVKNRYTIDGTETIFNLRKGQKETLGFDISSKFPVLPGFFAPSNGQSHCALNNCFGNGPAFVFPLIPWLSSYIASDETKAVVRCEKCGAIEHYIWFSLSSLYDWLIGYLLMHSVATDGPRFKRPDPEFVFKMIDYCVKCGEELTMMQKEQLRAVFDVYMGAMGIVPDVKFGIEYKILSHLYDKQRYGSTDMLPSIFSFQGELSTKKMMSKLVFRNNEPCVIKKTMGRDFLTEVYEKIGHQAAQHNTTPSAVQLMLAMVDVAKAHPEHYKTTFGRFIQTASGEYESVVLHAMDQCEAQQMYAACALD